MKNKVENKSYRIVVIPKSEMQRSYRNYEIRAKGLFDSVFEIKANAIPGNLMDISLKEIKR